MSPYKKPQKMLKNCFLKLSATLEEKEWKAFYAFACGIYSKQKVQIRLLNYVYGNRQKKNWKNMSFEKAYMETFAHQLETAKQKKKLLNTLSDLNTWLLDYLIWKDIKSDKLIRQIFIGEIYRKRNLSTRFLQFLTKAKQELIKNPIMDFWKSLKLMIISHLLTYNAVINDKRYRITEILDAVKYLDEFYFLAKLRYSASISSYKNVAVEETPILLLKEVKEEVSKPNYQTHEHIQLYYWLNKLSEERSTEAYEILKNQFYTLSFPDKNEGLDVATFLINYNVHFIRLGYTENAQDCLKIFQVGLNQSLYIVNGEMSSITFQNITNIACHLKIFDWSLSFIEEYGDYLPKKEKKDVIAICYARVFYGKKEYNKALEQLAKISSSTSVMEINRRSIQIQCFYDLKENKALLRTNCANLLSFLNRQQKVAPLIILSHKNFVQVIYKLLKPAPKKEILELIDEMDALAFKSCLLERIEQLE